MNILLVDDDPAIIKSLLPVLNGLGDHTTRVSTSFEKAWEHALDLGVIHLLVTDVVMEPVDGFSLRDRLRDRFPDLRVVLMSGYDLSDYEEQTKGYPLLQKPFENDELRAVVTRELEAAPEEPQVIEAATEDEEPETSADEATVVAPVSEKSEGSDSPPDESTKPEPAPPFPSPRPMSAPNFGVSAPKVPGTPVAMPRIAPVPPGINPPKATPPASLPTPTAKPASAVPGIPIPKVAAPAAGMPAPRATPAAAPVSVPKATPVAPPTATPRASPAAPPTIQRPSDQPESASQAQAPIARPPAPISKPMLKPSATPPSALRSPRPAGAPTIRPTVSAPGAQPALASVVKPPAAKPVVSGTPVAVPKPADKRAEDVPSASGVDADDLVGKQLGSYRVSRRIADGHWGPTYEAEQVSMGRTVAMQILSQDKLSDPEQKKQFIANASAKANIQHPVILSVYEAGEADGHCFYTHEHVDGQSLKKMQDAGISIDETTALLAIRVAAEGVHYINSQKVAHSPLQASSILVGSDKRPRLANLATYGESETPETIPEIQALGRIVSESMPPPLVAAGRLQKLFAKMQETGETGFQSWPALLQAVKALEPKIIPADAFKLGAQEQEAIRAGEAARKAQKKSIILGVAGMFSLLLAIGVAVWWMFIHTNERNTSEMVKIPAGEFIFQNGTKATLPDFYIGKYEVTIGQYARFLKALDDNPGPDGKPDAQYDHTDQPKGKTHYPRSEKIWKTYYDLAKAGKPARFIPIDLNSPVFNADWWDAYAYAKWKGQRLPTEQEWEKAARGTDGRKFTWGDEFDPKKVNSSSDFNKALPGPNTEAKVDGYYWWSPVDKFMSDSSPYDVIGMAGNLNEWTSTWETKDGTKFPVLRGGSYRSKTDDGKPEVSATFRFVGLDPEASQEFIGFRTASDTLPQK